MEVFIEDGNGLSLRFDKNPKGVYLEANDELKNKFKTLVKPKINNEKTDLIEGATKEEIDAFNDALIPNTISQMKFRMQLILSGISLESIYESINAIQDKTTRDIILTKFDYADVMERNDESLLQMASIMGITKEQINQIFINGNNIQDK